MRAEPRQIIEAAHLFGCHTSVVLESFTEWQEWCEAEGVDPEVMSFDNWVMEMRLLP